ncbi:acyl-CoA dehydrogenase family protein [Ancylobacter sp. Lp-2]|uniref:acyl-CoA dehydrogenase family protein n=1 Tax=Ancylobacter sp. Lp-2 TaxID=2881339 RepID=UPI001E3D8AC4|nr:acyl-CoA dehydrogenase family protein [Ancylobacter sp. Lp-2]MCB4770448.1 acyl-CoA dehydrogenase family protein [Ancylobacter sp. Lp-2]
MTSAPNPTRAEPVSLPLRLPDRTSLLGRVPALAECIAVGAAQRDIARELPFDAFVLFRESGLGALRLPRAWGGPGGTVEDAIELIATLAQADSNVAHALRPHFNFVELLVTNNADACPPLAQAVARGELFGSASTEIGTPRPGIIATQLSQRAGGFRLNGRKHYATGTAYADWVSLSALDEAGAVVRVLVPTNRAGVEILDDWDGMGQRLTASGGIVFEDVEVFADEISARPPGSHPSRHASTFRQLFLAACIAGIVRNIVTDATDYVRRQARPIAHSPAATARDDLFVQQAIGEIAALSYAVDSLLARAARTSDRAQQAIFAHAPDVDGILADNAVETAKAQVVIGELALKAAQRIFDAGGGSATSRALNFDRHWRNIRTLLSHNPSAYKAQVVGDHLINGTAPPTDGGFF